MNSRVLLSILSVLIFLLNASKAYSQDLTDAPIKKSLFLPPQNLKLYEKPQDTLTLQEQWKIRVHGLRMAALHPLVWGNRKIERTESRKMITIRPFYLRASENENFIFEEIAINFIFKKVSKTKAARKYHENDSVFDIGFAGTYQDGPPLSKPLRDDSYVIRLTAFDDFVSGLFYRSLDKHVLLKQGSPKEVNTGEDYDLKIIFTDNNATALLNGKEFTSLERENLNRGLLYLTTSWNPIHINDFYIKGHYAGKEKEPVTLNGIYKLAGLKKFK